MNLIFKPYQFYKIIEVVIFISACKNSRYLLDYFVHIKTNVMPFCVMVNTLEIYAWKAIVSFF